MESSTDRGVRVAELIGALSLATDLGLGQPQEHVLRQTMIARRLAAAAGCSEDDQDTVFYVSLLAWVGCISDSHELSKWFGDDIALRSDSYDVDKAGLPLVRFMVGHIGTDAPALRRLTILGRFLASGRSQAARSFVAHCQTTADIADRLGLSESVRVALGHSFERWDGMGAPDGLRGDQIDLAMRIVQIADDAEVHQRLHGTRQATEMVRSRRGTEFDPALVDVLTDHTAEIFDGLDDVDAWDRVLDSTHLGAEVVDDDALTAALEAFADYADLKSAWFLGHSRGVAALASGAAENVGLPADEVRLIERAALVHDLGVIGVSSGIWDKDGVLSPTELERVRTHPYLTERVLRRQPKLAEIGALAVLHHERLDGSGYPSGLRSGSIPFSARIVAAADVYRTRWGRIGPTAAAGPSAIGSPSYAGRSAPDASTEMRSRRSFTAPGSGPAAVRPCRPGSPERGRGAGAGGQRAPDQGDRPAAVGVAQDGELPHRAHLRQDRRLDPRCRCHVRHAQRPRPTRRSGLSVVDQLPNPRRTPFRRHGQPWRARQSGQPRGASITRVGRGRGDGLEEAVEEVVGDRVGSERRPG